MNYKVLYRKYRPQNFNDVCGQEYVVKTLKNAIKQNKISHAYIFTGPRGTGKTSLAKLFAKTINCENKIDGNPCLECTACKNFKENPDIIEIDAASNNGVDEIRELINNIKLAPSNSKYKVYIIDEVHMLSQSAFNALLLTLEEPPAHVVFILATTDIQNVPITILSRTQRFDFTRISQENIIKRLKFVCEQESIKISDEALEELAILAEGGLRDALSLLDQLASQTTDTIDLNTVLNTFGTISNQKIKEFIDDIDKNQIQNVILKINDFKKSSIDSKVFINKLVNLLKEIAIKIKLNEHKEQNLSFDVIKNIIFELNDMLNNKMISIDPYIIIQMIILNYMGNISIENNFPGNKIDAENTNNIKDQQKVTNENQKEKEELMLKFKNIRINNCFVNANKIDLEKVKKQWREFIEINLKNKTNFYLNISDTEIIVSSDKYFIIKTLSDSSAGLINNDLLNIENYFNEIFKTNYKIIAISAEEWTNVRNEYIKNINNHKKYEEQEEIKLQIDSKDDYDIIVNNIFENIKIEME